MKELTTLYKIEAWILHILQKLEKGQLFMTKELKIYNRNMLCRIFVLMNRTHALLVDGSYINQRALFYEMRHLKLDCNIVKGDSNSDTQCSYLFPSQTQVDTTIRKISRILGSSRDELHIYPNGKGLLSGAIALDYNSFSIIDCLREFPDGWCIPGTIEYLKKLNFHNLGAQYIIVIEKHGIFQSLLRDRFVHYLPSILICGQGYPSIATKFLFQRLARELQLPCLGLVDYNPDGLALLQTYRKPTVTDPNGSLDSRESTPINIYWLGLHFSQLSQLNLWENFRKPLTKRDLVLLRNLQSQLRPNAERQVTILENELKAMQNGKVELQAMFSLGHSYLSKVYLPLVIFHYQDFVPFL